MGVPVFIGRESLQVIINGIIIPTPVVSKVVAYPRKEPDGSFYLLIHVITDDGKKNTVIPKLCERAKAAFVEAYKSEHAPKLERFSWHHTGKDEATKIPTKAQVLYIRPAHSTQPTTQG